MNAVKTMFLSLGLSGLLSGCVTTPYDTGYVVPSEPVYYNTSPAYYATPVSGYSTMTVYDGYHPGYGGPRHHPHGHGSPSYDHGRYSHGGSNDYRGRSSGRSDVRGQNARPAGGGSRVDGGKKTLPASGFNKTSSGRTYFNSAPIKQKRPANAVSQSGGKPASGKSSGSRSRLVPIKGGKSRKGKR